MGTSISQKSPENRNWGPVFMGYIHGDVPVRRVLADIWRAAQNQPQSVSELIGTKLIFQIYHTIKESNKAGEALKKTNQLIHDSKANTIITEIAKRSIPNAYLSDQPAKEWPTSFFSELTNYFVSRDISGYVGENARNENVTSLIEFKKSLESCLTDTMLKPKAPLSSTAQWRKFVSETIENIKSGIS